MTRMGHYTHWREASASCEARSYKASAEVPKACAQVCKLRLAPAAGTTHAATLSRQQPRQNGVPCACWSRRSQHSPPAPMNGVFIPARRRKCGKWCSCASLLVATWVSTDETKRPGSDGRDAWCCYWCDSCEQVDKRNEESVCAVCE